jgi:hypothetical protein
MLVQCLLGAVRLDLTIRTFHACASHRFLVPHGEPLRCSWPNFNLQVRHELPRERQLSGEVMARKRRTSCRQLIIPPFGIPCSRSKCIGQFMESVRRLRRPPFKMVGAIIQRG